MPGPVAEVPVIEMLPAKPEPETPPVEIIFTVLVDAFRLTPDPLPVLVPSIVMLAPFVPTTRDAMPPPSCM